MTGCSSLSILSTTHYHGAHRRPIADVTPQREWFGTPGLVAFTHDLLTDGPLPTDYDQCDVFVSDLPWRIGFDIFNQRHGVTDSRTYDEYMTVISDLIERITVPVYLVTGRHALAYLPEPAATLPIMLNQDEAIAICYRPGDEVNGQYRNTWEFLYALAERYDSAGDPCCGYGRTARVFLQAGKRAVVSDMNPLCIGYIADHAAEWTQR